MRCLLPSHERIVLDSDKNQTQKKRESSKAPQNKSPAPAPPREVTAPVPAPVPEPAVVDAKQREAPATAVKKAPLASGVLHLCSKLHTCNIWRTGKAVSQQSVNSVLRMAIQDGSQQYKLKNGVLRIVVGVSLHNPSRTHVSSRSCTESSIEFSGLTEWKCQPKLLSSLTN